MTKEELETIGLKVEKIHDWSDFTLAFTFSHPRLDDQWLTLCLKEDVTLDYIRDRIETYIDRKEFWDAT